MGGTDATDVAPAWAWAATAVSGALAAASLVVDITLVLGGFAAVGVVYLLYRWGQYRDPPGRGSDGSGRREKETKVNADTFGGDQ